MSLNINFISNQYKDFAGYYVKAYETGTSTPKAIYFDDRKLSGASRVKIDKDGFFISDGGARVVLHIKGYYDLVFFETKEQANNNDFTSIIKMGDRLVAEISGDTIQKASETEYGTAKFANEQQILIGGNFPNNVLISEDRIQLMGELSAQEQKADADDLTNRDNTKWISPADNLQLITDNPIEDPKRELEIGDVTWLDTNTYRNTDEYLIADGNTFSAIDYPDLAALDGYSTVGETTVDGFSNPVKAYSGIDTNVSNGAIKFIEISENLHYGIIHETSTDGGAYNMIKSVDGANTFTILTQAATGATAAQANGSNLIWDNGDYILVAPGGSTISIFQISTETFTTLNYNMFNTGSPSVSGLGAVSHFNTNINKFVIMLHRSDTNNLYVIEFENDPATRTVTTITTSGADFNYFSPQISLNQKKHYFDGKYYLYDTLSKSIYSVEESTWTLSLVKAFTPAFSTNEAASKFNSIAFNDKNELYFILSFDTTTKEIEVVHSVDLINFDTYILDPNFSSSVSTPSLISIEDGYIIDSDGNFDIILTKDFTTLIYEKHDWAGGGSGTSPFYNYSADKLIRYTSGANSGNIGEIYTQTLDVDTTTSIGETTTPNLSYECYGNIIPVIKAK